MLIATRCLFIGYCRCCTYCTNGQKYKHIKWMSSSKLYIAHCSTREWWIVETKLANIYLLFWYLTVPHLHLHIHYLEETLDASMLFFYFFFHYIYSVALFRVVSHVKLDFCVFVSLWLSIIFWPENALLSLDRRRTTQSLELAKCLWFSNQKIKSTFVALVFSLNWFRIFFLICQNRMTWRITFQKLDVDSTVLWRLFQAQRKQNCRKRVWQIMKSGCMQTDKTDK